MNNDLAAFGAPKEVLAKADEEQDVFEVFEENEVIVRIFVRLATQWNVSNGAYLGLNYQSLDFIFRTERVKDRARVFEGIQVMELSALDALNKKEK